MIDCDDFRVGGVFVVLLNGFVLLLLLAAAAQDVATRRISNVWPLLILAAFAIKLFVVKSPISWGDVVGPLALFVAAAAAWRYRLIGGGDVKLMVAMCFFVGMPEMISFILYTSMFGGVLAIILLLCVAFKPRADSANPASATAGYLPYAPAFFLAQLMSFLPIKLVSF